MNSAQMCCSCFCHYYVNGPWDQVGLDFKVILKLGTSLWKSLSFSVFDIWSYFLLMFEIQYPSQAHPASYKLFGLQSWPQPACNRFIDTKFCPPWRSVQSFAALKDLCPHIFIYLQNNDKKGLIHTENKTKKTSAR